MSLAELMNECVAEGTNVEKVDGPTPKGGVYWLVLHRPEGLVRIEVDSQGNELGREVEQREVKEVDQADG